MILEGRLKCIDIYLHKRPGHIERIFFWRMIRCFKEIWTKAIQWKAYQDKKLYIFIVSLVDYRAAIYRLHQKISASAPKKTYMTNATT